MKGFLIVCGITVMAGLVPVTLSYVDYRHKDHESTLVSALNFVEDAIEASQGLNVELYTPSIDTKSNPGRWTLTGIMVPSNSIRSPDSKAFAAVLQQLCDARSHSCWRMEEFKLAGVGTPLAREIKSNGETTYQQDAVARLAGSLKRQMADMQHTQRQAMEYNSELAVVRAANIASTISRMGLDADWLISNLNHLSLASGGPLISASDGTANPDADAGFAEPIRGINEQWDRLFALKDLLGRLPITAPFQEYRISSLYGERQDPITGKRAYHSGIDLVAPLGSSVRATAPGTVTFAANRGRYGNTIEIDHGHGISTRYGHLREIFVAVGQEIEHGHKIAIMGNSGRSTGPHLHYEVRSRDKTLDPVKFLQASGETHSSDLELSIANMELWTGRPQTGALLLAE